MKTNRLFLGALGAFFAVHLLIIGLCWLRPSGADSTAPSTAAASLPRPASAP